MSYFIASDFGRIRFGTSDFLVADNVSARMIVSIELFDTGAMAYPLKLVLPFRLTTAVDAGRVDSYMEARLLSIGAGVCLSFEELAPGKLGAGCGFCDDRAIGILRGIRKLGKLGIWRGLLFCAWWALGAIRAPPACGGALALGWRALCCLSWDPLWKGFNVSVIGPFVLLAIVEAMVDNKCFD